MWFRILGNEIWDFSWIEILQAGRNVENKNHMCACKLTTFKGGTPGTEIGGFVCNEGGGTAQDNNTAY